MKKITILLMLCFVSVSVHAEYFFMDNRDVGWYFYEDEQVNAKKPPAKPKRPKLTMVEDNADAILNDLQHRFKKAKTRAVLFPTDDNLGRYVQLQRQMLVFSEQFGEHWKAYLVRHPEMDDAARHPISSAGRTIANAETQKQRTQTTSDISKRVSLFFFYDVNCPYCQKFSPILKRFTDEVGMAVLPISTTSEKLPEWPDSRLENGLAKTLGVSQWPDVAIVDNATKTVLGHISGFRTEDELIDVFLSLDKGAPHV